MSATQLFLNDQLVTITAEASVIKRLNEDDHYLADYVNKAAKMGQFGFLFKDHPVKRIIVRRTTPTAPILKPVWYKKGRPSEADSAATALLLRLRGSEKYQLRFKDYAVRAKLWEEIASDMRNEGFDVDGHKCSQKFLNLAQSYYKYRHAVESCTCSDEKMYPPEYYEELRKILSEKGEEGNTGNSEAEDEEWLPKTRKRRKAVEEDSDEFFKKLLKKNSEQKDERFKEVCDLLKKRNNMIKEKLKQNEKIISLLDKFINKS